MVGVIGRREEEGSALGLSEQTQRMELVSVTLERTAKDVGLGRRETGEKKTPASLQKRRRREVLEVWNEETTAKRMEEITEMVARMFPTSAITSSQIKAVVREAFATVDNLFAENDAVDWGKDFEWEPEVYTRDAAVAESMGYDLERMACSQHKSMLHDRLSEDRVQKWVPEVDPDHARMLRLAQGMQLLRAEEFEPNGTPPPMRTLYKKVHKAVNKVQSELWKSGLVFILPRAVADKCGTLHYSPAHWARKAGKKSGRCIFDSSDGKYNSPLNSDEARVRLEALYGNIEHPTLDELVQMIMEYADEMKEKLGEEFRWEDLVLWKGDLKGAFTLLFFDPDCIRYLACELTDGLVMVYHSGLFGWTGTPFAFQVITRVIVRNAGARVRGKLRMFVDDVMGVTMIEDLRHDKKVFQDIAEGLLGSAAVAQEKWEEGLRLTWIGWTLDLKTRQVTISRRNFLKALYGFFTADPDGQFQVCEIEKLASWSSRYSTILRVMKPFSICLYAELTGMKSHYAYKKLRAFGSKLAILVWRTLLCMLDLDETSHARTFGSFLTETPTILLEFDSSLWGMGLSITCLDSGRRLGVCAFQFPFDLDQQSKWQNVVEFLAVVMGCLCLAHMGIRNVNIKLKGDNVSSLVWCSTEHFGSKLGFRAVLLYIIIAAFFGYRVVDVEHVAGVDNTFHDALSRGTRPELLGVPREDILHFVEETQIRALMVACNPKREISSVGEFLCFWEECREGIEWLKSSKDRESHAL